MVFVVWLALRIGGDQVTTAVDDLGEAVAAGTAALSCGLAARRTRFRLHRAWTLLAASAGSWCAGEVAWSVYEVALHQEVPFPSVADIGFLAAIPLAIAGILAFAHTSRGTSTGLRLWFDRIIVATSLTFVGWELGLGQILAATDESLFDRLVSLAYPIGDLLIGTVLILAIRRATDETQGRLLLLLAGLGANAIADSAFAYLNATGNYGVVGSELDAGWVIGYLAIALAALWPSEVRDQTHEEKPVDVWQLILPWITILVGGSLAVVQVFRGHPLDVSATVLAALVIALVMVSQVLAQHDSLTLVYRSKLAATTLNDVIVNAPLGMSRVSTDLTVLQVNPTLAAVLGTSVAGLTGAKLLDFFAESERPLVRQSIASAAELSTVEFEAAANSAQASVVWLRVKATAVRRAGGSVDYFVVMFEDVSAQRAAAQTAAANLEVLQRLNRVKSQFMTKVRHEFRTALVGIEGFGEYIAQTDDLDPADVRSMAGDIVKEARHLGVTLDDMVRLDSAEERTSTIKISDVDLSSLLRDAAASVQMGAAGHPIRVEIGDLPIVQVDPDLVTQMITSLLGRAIEYSPPDAEVLMSAHASDAEVRISVSDRGAAFAADLEAQLIGHGRGTQSRSPARALSTDVGLPMARQIVEQHGGRIWFDVGDGTTFHVVLPIVAGQRRTSESAGAGVPSG